MEIKEQMGGFAILDRNENILLVCARLEDAKAIAETIERKETERQPTKY